MQGKPLYIRLRGSGETERDAKRRRSKVEKYASVWGVSEAGVIRRLIDEA